MLNCDLFKRGAHGLPKRLYIPYLLYIGRYLLNLCRLYFVIYLFMFTLTLSNLSLYDLLKMRIKWAR